MPENSWIRVSIANILLPVPDTLINGYGVVATNEYQTSAPASGEPQTGKEPVAILALENVPLVVPGFTFGVRAVAVVHSSLAGGSVTAIEKSQFMPAGTGSLV